ncbi:hypothetical protein BGZ95_009786 [Linnemannia exigua]|uniref:Uncharacterized protein n=1 Tax=Linnemannia exigua TaxID=604196 RepID=A0AAD4DC76_9FUNG|nr:hypothetical protein BGZ95_009786 [Linnemannia exigua]
MASEMCCISKIYSVPSSDDGQRMQICTVKINIRSFEGLKTPSITVNVTKDIDDDSVENWCFSRGHGDDAGNQMYSPGPLCIEVSPVDPEDGSGVDWFPALKMNVNRCDMAEYDLTEDEAVMMWNCKGHFYTFISDKEGKSFEIERDDRAFDLEPCTIGSEKPCIARDDDMKCEWDTIRKLAEYKALKAIEDAEKEQEEYAKLESVWHLDLPRGWSDDARVVGMK